MKESSEDVVQDGGSVRGKVLGCGPSCLERGSLECCLPRERVDLNWLESGTQGAATRICTGSGEEREGNESTRIFDLRVYRGGDGVVGSLTRLSLSRKGHSTTVSTTGRGLVASAGGVISAKWVG